MRIIMKKTILILLLTVAACGTSQYRKQNKSEIAFSLAECEMKQHVSGGAIYPQMDSSFITTQDDSAFIIEAYISTAGSSGMLEKTYYSCVVVYLGGEISDPNNWSICYLNYQD